MHGERGSCRYPLLLGNPKFAFEIEPAKGLVTPSSVAVIVNPSQAQLLLGEADRLRAKANQLKQEINSEHLIAGQALLRESVKEAIADVDKTETTFKQRGLEPSSSGKVDAFFDDIRLSYGEALQAVSDGSGKIRQTEPGFVHARLVLGDKSAVSRSASDAVIASILHNADAYDVVALSKAITFNLDVNSTPQGATISYRRRGEEFETLDRKTNSRIENITRAVYTIRLQMKGYEDVCTDFDAMNSTRSSVDLELKRKTGSR